MITTFLIVVLQVFMFFFSFAFFATKRISKQQQQQDKNFQLYHKIKFSTATRTTTKVCKSNNNKKLEVLKLS